LDCDTSGTITIILARTPMHLGKERNNAPKSNHHAGQGAMEAL
jgi:hypothetical protein